VIRTLKKAIITYFKVTYMLFMQLCGRIEEKISENCRYNGQFLGHDLIPGPP
jgi:hypothetical protein